MSLFRLTYCSRATAPPDYATLTALMKVAQERNEQDGITGMLCYSEGHYFQCLEGPRATVSRTMGRIYADARHRDIVIVDAWVVRERVFPGWAVKVIEPGELPPETFLRLFAEPVGGYAPGLRDANRLFGFLAKVAETLSAAPATSYP